MKMALYLLNLPNLSALHAGLITMPLMQRCQTYWRELANDIQKRPLYWLTMALALLGAYWSSDPSDILRGAGFFVWIFSNGYLLYHFLLERNTPMILLFICYEIFNIRGVLNNW